MEQYLFAVPRMHLVTDEVTTVRARGWRTPIRVRIWRAAGQPAVVLSIQTKDGSPPSWVSSKLANHVNRVYLGFNYDCAIFFESELEGGVAKLYRVEYDLVGHDMRATYIRPRRYRCKWIDLYSLTGEQISE